MTTKGGIADLMDRQLTLEERIEAHLKRAPNDTQLTEDYIDPSDRQNVRHRALIAAVLDACFEHSFPNSDVEAVEVEIGQNPDIWSTLAHARNAFNRDARYLDNGKKAKSCLRPAAKESIIPVTTIGAARKLIVVWLATIEVWDKSHDGNHIKRRQDVMNIAATASGTTYKTYKTYRSYMKRSLLGEVKRFSPEEQKLYSTLININKTGGGLPSEAESAFDLLLPAALALSEQKIPAQLFAENLKG